MPTKNAMPPQNQQPKGPKAIPSQLQLPGGIVLKGMPFKIVAYNPDGTPKLFELQPPGPHDLSADGACVLFAREELLRNPWPRKAHE
jgi:hypothetical protein